MDHTVHYGQFLVNINSYPNKGGFIPWRYFVLLLNCACNYWYINKLIYYLCYLQHGGIVALYHPCADLREISLLKKLVKSCLRRYVISPSRELSKERVGTTKWQCFSITFSIFLVIKLIILCNISSLWPFLHGEPVIQCQWSTQTQFVNLFGRELWEDQKNCQMRDSTPCS